MQTIQCLSDVSQSISTVLYSLLLPGTGGHPAPPPEKQTNKQTQLGKQTVLLYVHKYIYVLNMRCKKLWGKHNSTL